MAHTCELAEPSTAGAHGVAHEERTTEPFEWRAWRDVEEGSLAAPQTDNVAPTDTSHHPLALPPRVLVQKYHLHLCLWAHGSLFNLMCFPDDLSVFTSRSPVSKRRETEFLPGFIWSC